MPNFGILSLFLERLSVAPLCKIWVPFRRDSAVAHPNGTEPLEFIVPDAAQVCVFSVTSPAHSSLQYSQLPLGIESAGKEHGGKEHGGKELESPVAEILVADYIFRQRALWQRVCWHESGTKESGTRQRVWW